MAKNEWVVRQGTYSCESLKVMCSTEDGEFVRSVLLDERESLESEAEQLAADLNELEAYKALGTPEELAAIKEEQRWRKIGKGEPPEPGQMCQFFSRRVGHGESLVYRKAFSWNEHFQHWSDGLSTIRGDGSFFNYPVGESHIVFTHWRPTPTDVPKEEG